MNATLFPSARSKIVGQTAFFNLGIVTSFSICTAEATSQGEGKIQTS